MAKLIITLDKKTAVRMKAHLEIEHPVTKGRMKILG